MCYLMVGWPSGECQVLFRDPGGSHSAREAAKCSYRTVPRGSRTLSTPGTRLYWCWGYETGVNEAGAAGGNGAVERLVEAIDPLEERWWIE